jgi:DNA-binding transcriptional ArsR family regulator
MPELSHTFSALSHPIRREMLEKLSAGEQTVLELARPFAVSLPAISRHLRVLEGAGLVSRKVEGREHRISLNPAPLREASEWMGEYKLFWEGQFDSLQHYLERSQKE